MSLNINNIKNLKKQMRAKEAFNLMKENKFNESIDLFTKAIELDSNDWRLFVNRSYCYQQIKQFNEALVDANHAIHLDNKQIASHYRKGCILLCLKLFRSAEKTFKDGLNCDPNDENSKFKLTETLRLFIKEFGFNNNREIEQLMELFGTCSAFSDALISGQLFDVYDFGTDFGTDSLISCESVRKIPDESDLNKSIELDFDYNIDNEDNSGFIPLVNSNNGSVSDVNSISSSIYSIRNGDLIGFQTPDFKTNDEAIDRNDNMIGIRLPKSVPIFHKSLKDLNRNERKSIPTILKTPEVSTLIKDSINSSSESKESTPKQMVKTRPSFRITINK